MFKLIHLQSGVLHLQSGVKVIFYSLILFHVKS